MELLAFSLEGLFSNWVAPLAGFIIGLGLVVFVHELGHFLVAKAVGIKVERFAMGFGPKVLGATWGETEYCLNALPLGGYVKMLGQEDFKPMDGEQGAGDPRAYYNKSVGARLAVIAAGVVMNVIFAAILFIVVAMIGKNFPAPVVGDVVPGWPAATAEITWQGAAPPSPAPATQAVTAPASEPQSAPAGGLQPGDTVLAINGDEISRFTSIAMTAALASPSETFTFRIRREVDGNSYIGQARLGVKTAPSGMNLAFGISAPADTTVELLENLKAPTPLKTGDRIVAIADQPVRHQWDISRIMKTLNGQPVEIRYERPTEDGTVTGTFTRSPRIYSSPQVYLSDGHLLRGVILARTDAIITLLGEDGQRQTYDANKLQPLAGEGLLDMLGMTPRMAVGAVIDGSPADDAGLEPGDIVLDYGDVATPTHRQFLEVNQRFAGTDGTDVVVLRDGQRKTLHIAPQKRKGAALVGITPLLDWQHPVVAAVRKGSPAAEAGLAPSAELTAVIAGDQRREVTTWNDLYTVLLAFQGRSIAIEYALGEQTLRAEVGPLDKAVFSPDDYALDLFGQREAFRPLTVNIQKSNPISALAWGVEETGAMVLSGYLSLRALIAGWASTEGMMGPVGIGGLAVSAGRQGIMELVYLMAFISSVVAVFNFLPLPVLDGGHAVFLIVEKIRGKPLPPKVMNAIQMAGLVLILGVFVLVTWQDISRMVGELW